MASQTPKPTYDAGHVPMSEEMDSASRRLPPVVPVLIGVVIVAIVIFLFARVNKPVAPASASITKTFYVEQSTKDRVLVGVEVHVKNSSDKPIFIRDEEVKVTTPQGEFTDTPAPANDVPRYYQAYPALKQSSSEALSMDTKIAAGAERDGLLIVGFPVPKDGWEARKSLQVTINLFDHAPLVIKQ